MKNFKQLLVIFLIQALFLACTPSSQMQGNWKKTTTEEINLTSENKKTNIDGKIIEDTEQRILAEISKIELEEQKIDKKLWIEIPQKTISLSRSSKWVKTLDSKTQYANLVKYYKDIKDTFQNLAILNEDIDKMYELSRSRSNDMLLYSLIRKNVLYLTMLCSGAIRRNELIVDLSSLDFTKQELEKVRSDDPKLELSKKIAVILSKSRFNSPKFRRIIESFISHTKGNLPSQFITTRGLVENVGLLISNHLRKKIVIFVDFRNLSNDKIDLFKYSRAYLKVRRNQKEPITLLFTSNKKIELFPKKFESIRLNEVERQNLDEDIMQSIENGIYEKTVKIYLDFISDEAPGRFIKSKVNRDGELIDILNKRTPDSNF